MGLTRATTIKPEEFGEIQDCEVAESSQQDLLDKPAVISIAHNKSAARTPDGRDGSPLPSRIGARNLLDEPELSKPLTPTQLRLLRRFDPEHNAVKPASAPPHSTGLPQETDSTSQKVVANGAATTKASQSSTNVSITQQSTTQEHIRDTRMSFFDDKLAEFMPISAERVQSYEAVNKPQAETPNTGTESASRFGVANLLQLQNVMAPSVSKNASHEVAPLLYPKAGAFWYQENGSGKLIYRDIDQRSQGGR